MRVVTLLAIGSLALAPSLAWADDTHLRFAGRIGAVPVIVAFLISAESSPPQSGGQTQNDGNQQVGNHNKSIQGSENNRRDAATQDWAELMTGMKTMDVAMGSVKRSGDSDVDFVKLMLPHHQAAIDMAKTQLLHGKDPQMRRLALEIITDQQSEIVLMQLWLKQHDALTSGMSAAVLELSSGLIVI
jgi:Domain of unknown function (DUF305)